MKNKMTDQVPEDIKHLKRIFSMPDIEYINIYQIEKLKNIEKKWLLIAELNTYFNEKTK